jgi:hypothetical protein
MGRFKDGKFDLVVVANFAMTAATFTEWRRSFEKASELFWDASEGQMQYGRIFVCDESIGLDSAEIILHASGDPSYGTFGQFGVPGQALHLMPYVRFQVLTHHHEMGHHVWALGEEYAAEAVLEEIDTSVTPANNATVPLVGSSFAADELVGADAILKFGSQLERRSITANTTTSLTVNPAFSQSPLNDSNGRVQYQFAAECAAAANPRFCIMENSRDAAGTLDAAGVWTPKANPVTEFCTNSNHDPDGNTQQETRNAQSCWETIVSRTGYTGLTLPDPAAAGPTTGFTIPEWIVLDKQPRFALLIDRSGSMSQGNKMADARHGAVYWLEFCAVGNDLLSIVSYDDQIDALLGLTQVSTLGGLAAPIATINALMPRGATNIRDALFAARDQIESLPTRAAVQVALLLTDGRHNFPSGSSALEAIEEYQEGGIRLYTLGVGQPANVDMGVLDALAAETGGRSFAVGDNQPGVVEAAMVEINAEVRGGIITTEPVLFPDSKASGLDTLLAPLLESRQGTVPPRRRPLLAQILDAARVREVRDLLRRTKRRSNRLVAIPVDVEAKADRVSFATVHSESDDLWLYLVDPSGAVVPPSAVGVSHVESSAPHEFVVVEQPLPGRWLVVVVRTRPGKAFAARLVAGGENRNLQVFGTAPPLNALGAAVKLTASARWQHELTGLRVFATIEAPSGGRQQILLHDDLPGRPGSGRYEGVYSPTESGRHRGLLTIVGSSQATIADPLTRLAHSENGVIDTQANAPNFIRRVVVYFDAGVRPEDKQKEEKPHGRPGRPRPTPLKSAPRRRRTM